jgi:hypothetical protein
MKKYFSLFIAAVLILSIALSFLPAFAADNEYDAKKISIPVMPPVTGQDLTGYQVGQIIDKLSTETSTTTYKGNGQYSLNTAVGPINYKDDYSNPDEYYKSIDTTVVNGQVTKAPYILTIDAANKSVFIKDKRTGDNVTISMQSLGKNDVKGKGNAVISGNSATWTDIATDTDIKIVAGNTGVKFQRILKSDKADTQATFNIDQKGQGINVNYVATQSGKTIPLKANLDKGILTEDIDRSKADTLSYPLTIDPTIDVSVSASSDDAMVIPATSDIELSIVYLNFGKESTTPYKSGIRFANVQVPKYATINSSYMQFTGSSDGEWATTCNANIYAENVDNAATYSTYANFDGRSLTSAVAWNNIGAWTQNSQTNAQTPDITTLVTAIMGRSGWATGNAIAFEINDNSSSNGAGRHPWSYDHGTMFPVLHIDYTANWYSPSWSYRKSFTVSHATGALTNYQVPVRVYYGSGTDGTEVYDNLTIGKVYTGSTCNTNFSDIRFTSGNGVTALNYYTENNTTSNNALFWVKLDSIGTSATTFYVYYGNSGVATASSGSNTFIKFDDFEGSSNGTTLTTPWTHLNGTTIYTTSQAYSGAGSYSGEWAGTANYADAYIPSSALTENKTIMWRIWKTDSADTDLYWGGSSYMLNFAIGTDEIVYYYDTSLKSTGASITAGTWQTIEVKNINLTARTCDIFVNYTAAKIDAGLQASGSYNGQVRFYEPNNTTNGRDFYLDNFYIRNDTPAQPVFGSWGAQQGVSLPIVTTGTALAYGTTSENITGNSFVTNGWTITKFGIQYGTNITTYGSWDNVTATITASPYTWADNITSLSAATLYYYRAFAENTTDFFGNQSSFLTIPAAPTSLSPTPGAGQVAFTWSNASGDAGTTIYTQVQYSASAYPTSYTDGTTGISWTTGTSGTVTGLTSGTLYYFSAFSKAVNGLTSYSTASAQVTSTPVGSAVITLSAATSTQDTTATLNGNITSVGGSNPTVTVYWGTTDGGQTPGSWANSAAPTSPVQPQGVAAFSYNATGLPTGTTIYFSAKATNAYGTAWPAASLSFLTKPAAPTSVAATDGASPSYVTVTWTASTGATAYHIWRDGSDLGAQSSGYQDTGAGAPTITPGTATATDGSSTSYVTLTLSGQSASNGASSSYYVVASNATGNSSNSATDTGYRGTTTLTYQWQRSAGDSDASYSNIGSATSNPYNDTAAPAPTVTPGTASATDGSSTSQVSLSIAGASANAGAGRYYKCVVSMTGASNATSSADRGYIGVGSLTYQWQRSSGDSDASYSSLGGATIASYNDTAAPAPTITAGTAAATDGTFTNKVTLSLTGQATNTTGRYYYCVVSATGAADANTTHDRGYIGAGSITYQWQVSSGDSDATYSDIGGATTASYDYTSAPAPTVTPGTASATDGTNSTYVTLSISGASGNNGAGRYYKCVENATGAAQATSSSDRGYTGGSSLTYQWYRSAGDSDASYTLLSGATTAPYNDSTAPAPTITPGTATATDGTSTSYVTLTLSGASASNGAGRYYYCVVTAGAANGNTTTDRGYEGTASLTYQWQRSAGDSDAAYSNIGSATSNPYNDTGAPAATITPGTASATDGTSSTQVTLTISGASASAGAGRYFKCIVSMSGASDQNSTADRGYIGASGTLTYQWWRSSGTGDSGFSSIGGATTATYNDTAAPSPTITPGAATASDGTSSFYVSLSVSGQSGNNGAIRYYYCVVSMTGATDQNTTHDSGYTIASSLSYQWWRSAADSDASFSSLAGASTSAYNDTTGAITPDGRYYYCAISMSGASDQNTTHDRGYRATFVAATIVTGVCSGYYGSGAILNGTIVAQGDGPVTQRGFDYGLTGAYGSSSLTTAPSSYSNGAYSASITGLTKSTQYHYRAKAFNGAWGYGLDSIFSTTGSPAIEFYFQTASDNQTNIYGVNWASQTFTTDNVTAKSVTSVRLLLKRVGSPGNVTVSIRDTSAGAATGVDLVSGTLNGTAMDTAFTWYEFPMTTEKPLHLITQYAICVSASSGDVSNYVAWAFVNAGGYTGGNGLTSANSGLSWTTKTYDYNFEIWGNASIFIQDAKVFMSYRTTGDWLIVARYVNTFPPYYNTYDIKKYFAIQLIDSAGTVLTSNPITEWGNRVGSIYLAPSQVTSLDWNGTYKVRIQGLFTGTPYTEYSLTSADWLGDDLTQLDSWCFSSAVVIGTYESTSTVTKAYTANIATRGTVLNSSGGDIITAGIPGLATVRPQIFQIYTTGTQFTPGTGTATNANAIRGGTAAAIGPKADAAFTQLGTVLGGVNSKQMIAIIACILAAVIAGTTFPFGHTTAANFFVVIILFTFVYFGFDPIYIATLYIVAAFLLAKKLWIDTGM